MFYKLVTDSKYLSQIATLLFKGVWLLWPLPSLIILQIPKYVIYRVKDTFLLSFGKTENSNTFFFENTVLD